MAVTGITENASLQHSTKAQTIGPRIGNKYQAKLPTLTKQSNSISNFGQCSRNMYQGKHDSNTSSEEIFISKRGFDEKNWSDDEKNYFLFGLFVFNKDFVEVKRFLETKDMGEILCYYYGKFYSSLEHYRLSDCRKMNSHKGSFGWRIFSGCRQKQLLSRMLPRVTDGSRKTLLKVFKAVENGKITSLIDYVFSLKAIVGRDILVEAVGLGEKDQDLARMALEPWRCSRVTKEVWPSLSTREILQNINQRLSKSRSSELFWEAVWPRLVAKGWHSEFRKKKYDRKCLVFLVPGIGKWDNTKLVKGEQYFNCEITVLRRVAAQPQLIEVDGGDENVREITTLSKQCHEFEENTELEENVPSTQHFESLELKVSLRPNSCSDATPQRHRALFDLNVPYMEGAHESEDITPKEQPILERRHSTRSRPPTTKMIELAAHGYERRKRKRKISENDDA